MNLQGLDERVSGVIRDDFGLTCGSPVLNMPFEVSLFLFILFSFIAGCVAGYNWYRIFKGDHK